MLPILSYLASAGLDLLSDFIDAGKDKAVEIIKEKTGIDLARKKKLTQEDILKLKELQQKERDFILEQTKLFLQDKANARHMQEVALGQEDWFAKNYVNLLASFWSLAAVIYIFYITIADIPKENIRFVDTTLGFMLGTIIAGIIGFYFGSSLGSKNKEEMLKQLKKG